VRSVLLRNSLRLGVAAFITAALALWFERIAYVWYPMLAVRVLGTITGGLVTFLVHTVLAGGPLQGLHGAQAELLQVVADRLEQWNRCLEVPHRHRPAPPSPPLTPPPRWRSLERWLHDPDLDGIELFRLQRNASRLMLCGQALRSIEQAEHRWRTLGEAPG
jgi:hypothetical protein